MKVYLEKPTHRLSLQITSKARELGILYGPKSIISNRPSRKHLIVIANGSPDNIVLVLLAYLLNHSTIVDMVFPMYKHISILDHVVEYIGRGYENIMVVIDQEELDLERISGILARKFPRISRVDDRLFSTWYSRGCRNALLVFCLNGLSNIGFKKHTIEEHLIAYAQRIGLNISFSSVSSDKDLWRKLDKSSKIHVYRSILGAQIGDLVDVFKQQIKGLAQLIGYASLYT